MRLQRLAWITVTVAAIGLSLLSACGDGDSAAQRSPAPSEVTGVVTDVDSGGIDDIRSFTLRSEGATYEIHIADDVDYGFPLGHLQEHRTSSEPVKVELDERDGRLYALSIEDV